jgi:hypothetical protein
VESFLPVVLHLFSESPYSFFSIPLEISFVVLGIARTLNVKHRECNVLCRTYCYWRWIVVELDEFIRSQKITIYRRGILRGGRRLWRNLRCRCLCCLRR